MAWKDLSCLQKTAKIVQVIALLAIALCLIMNVVAFYRAADETWYTPCDHCMPKGNVKCTKCCSGCSIKDAAFFYIARFYSIVFCVIAMVAEAKTNFFERYLKMCHFFAPRGLWQIFLGFCTLQANVFPGSGDLPWQWEDLFGYCLMTVGVIHLILGAACVKEDGPENQGSQSSNGGGTHQQQDPESSRAGPSQI